jgi:tetratricopeptide (TPR) repeat protein
MGMLYSDQGKIDEAEALYRTALEIQQKALGAEHLDVARTLNNLAGVCQMRRQYREAEDLYFRVLAIQESKLGKEHLEIARTFNNLAGAYFAEGRLDEAESLYLRALTLQEKTLRTRIQSGDAV